MIKAVILDIDGVIVGGKPGINFPFPNSDVIKALQKINKKTKVFLCTAKPSFAITDLVSKIGLNSVNITCGGAEIKDYRKKKFIKKHLINSKSAKKYVDECKKLGLYIEVYSSREYAIEKSSYCDLTKINISILGKKPKSVDSLTTFILENEIIKIMPAAFNRSEIQKIKKLMAKFPELQLEFGANPIYAPTLFAVITAKGVNKKSGAIEISKFSKIPFTNILGVGDGISDWEFIKLCKYGATLENGRRGIKELVLSKGEKFSFIGPSVNENGILDILKYFKIN
ncbi:hypothetical protein A2954_01290 [Candidatus Roizmanbacteria bacterium RIFCSPLOWO2_01_FULL_37_12]|uniref:Uncharacterized protein n=1 Tax=Candidatus Roizmanbacteria bacterium RIFCSPLOWO2_01_FULL_37_12 TaxID=1802056 RepID=A0A1F7IGJ8_9BACT|nr:MAG: hypothetical protein A3D76_06000 [Candidatus Roizmanbacteria bacterium RIFCSPHIGHO2_02_FULL_37_9b]OGK42459.1 MAG: hypothetical protein A2954_01290 [Candidatus Roizmanbacteria bacterium RIFCSPLOWO2_01_FULL_37_12]